MIIQLESGQKLELPDGAKPEDIDDAVSHFQQSSQPSPNVPLETIFSTTGENPTSYQQDLASKGSRFLKGMANAPNAIGQMMLHGAEMVQPGLTGGASDYLDRKLASDEMAYEKAKEATGFKGMDWMQALGGIAATAPVAAALPAAGYLQAMGSGAVSGLMTPATSGDNFAGEKLKQAGMGAAAGAAGQALGRMLAPKVSGELQTLLNEGITPTPGQVIGGMAKKVEDKLTSVPVLGDQIANAQRRAVEDLNRAAYERALAPIGQKFEGNVGREGVESVQDMLGKFYDQAIPNTEFAANSGFVNDIAPTLQKVKSLGGEQIGQFQRIMKNEFADRLNPNGAMDGETAKQVLSTLRQKATNLKGDSLANNRELGKLLSEVHDTIKNNLSEIVPGAKAQIANADKGWANFARIRDAASRIGSQEGIFTPAQLQAAVRAGDKSVGKGGFATGNALMQDLSEAGQKVLGGRYPDSGTAGRLAQMNMPSLLFGLGAGALGAVPYSRMGQAAIAASLAQRPEFMRQAGNALAKYDAIPFERLLASYYQANPQRH